MQLLGMLLLGVILGVIFGISMCKFWDNKHED